MTSCQLQPYFTIFDYMSKTLPLEEARTRAQFFLIQVPTREYEHTSTFFHSLPIKLCQLPRLNTMQPSTGPRSQTRVRLVNMLGTNSLIDLTSGLSWPNTPHNLHSSSPGLKRSFGDISTEDSSTPSSSSVAHNINKPSELNRVIMDIRSSETHAKEVSWL